MNTFEFEEIISDFKDSVLHFNLILDHKTKNCKGYCFVYLKDDVAARKFIDCFDGWNIRGKKLFSIFLCKFDGLFNMFDV
jgi:RNA recognition motif-containing protein